MLTTGEERQEALDFEEGWSSGDCGSVVTMWRRSSD
jgi:hypothetical protein